jgi:hypothetical protein
MSQLFIDFQCNLSPLFRDALGTKGFTVYPAAPGSFLTRRLFRECPGQCTNQTFPRHELSYSQSLPSHPIIPCPPEHSEGPEAEGRN